LSTRKVDARLVGRTWFVNIDSLTEHKSSKYTKPTLKEAKTPTKQPQAGRLAVSSVFTNKAVKSIASKTSNNNIKARNLQVLYEKDEENLMPNITRKVIKSPKMVRVELAETKKLKITVEKDTVSPRPDNQPKVALSGKLKVELLPESEPIKEYLKSENSEENITITAETRGTKFQEKLNKTLPEPAHDQSLLTPIEDKMLTVAENKTPEKINLISLVNNSDIKAKRAIEITASDSKITQPVRISTSVSLSPLIATALALVTVSIIFSASSNVVATRNSYESNVLIQAENLIEFFR